MVTHIISFVFCFYVDARLVHDALCVCAPPCSLFGPACTSVHRRHILGPAGDESVYKVRLSNRIWRNFVPGRCNFWDDNCIDHGIFMHIHMRNANL